MRMSDERLAKRSAAWRDSVWQSTEAELPSRLRLHRPGRTPWFRWEDELRRYAEKEVWKRWQTVALNREMWNEHAKAFVKYASK